MLRATNKSKKIVELSTFYSRNLQIPTFFKHELYFRGFNISFDSESKTVYMNGKLFHASVIHISTLLLNETVSAELQNKT